MNNSDLCTLCTHSFLGGGLSLDPFNPHPKLALIQPFVHNSLAQQVSVNKSTTSLTSQGNTGLQQPSPTHSVLGDRLQLFQSYSSCSHLWVSAVVPSLPWHSLTFVFPVGSSGGPVPWCSWEISAQCGLSIPTSFPCFCFSCSGSGFVPQDSVESDMMKRSCQMVERGCPLG